MAVALTLGDIDLKSALNQPFDAEIPVTGDSADDISALTVSVAPADTFEQYGLDRAKFLGQFQIDVVANGAAGVVRITSPNAVVEPFVTLLLEVAWPQGRLLREYTVLLDPPVFATETVAPAVEGAAAGPAASPKPVRRSAPPPSAARPAPSVATPQPRGPVDGSHGPVQRNET
ncbi:MAG: FimV family protein, partial [Gammaproteobacteria bacterium]